MSEYNELDMVIDFYDPKRFVDGCRCEPDVNYTCELCSTYDTLREAKRMLLLRDTEIERLRGDAASLAVAREQLLVQADEIKRLLRSHYEIEGLRDRLTELQCRLATKENELSMADAEIERLQKDRSRSENELDRLREWVAAVESGYEQQAKEIERLKALAIRAWHSFRSGGLTQANGMPYCLSDADMAELKRLADADAAKLREQAPPT